MSWEELAKHSRLEDTRPVWFNNADVGKLIGDAVNEAVAHMAAELAEAKQRIEELEVELEIANSEPYGDSSSSPTWHSVSPKKRGMF